MATPTLQDYYLMNPMSVIDRNTWLDREALVEQQFVKGPSIYTPLIDWVNRSQQTGAETSEFTEILEGDVDNDEIAMNAVTITDPQALDSRSRQMTVKRYGDKVQLSDTSSIFQQWNFSGGRDWRPLLRNALGNNVRRKIEVLSRNSYLMGPKDYWTYANGGASFNDLDVDAKFGIDIVNAWNLRLGNTGSPVIPGDAAAAKVSMLPPGAIYDFMDSLSMTGSGEAALCTNAKLYKDVLKYEIGTYKSVRFVEVPNDSTGYNSSVLYNAGRITIQAEVSVAITAGDGAPDPETTKVDEVWNVGQKEVTHYIQLAGGTDMSLFTKHDMVTIHSVRTDVYGVTNGVSILSGKTIVRRIVAIDVGNLRLSFDRPVMRNYNVDLGSGVYAYVTKGVHVGFCLTLGSRGGVVANVNRPIQFYDPMPYDDFKSIWRFVWDIKAGFNMWNPYVFECHFVAVSLPKPGGIQSPPAFDSGS
jgi:hypothetical protein